MLVHLWVSKLIAMFTVKPAVEVEVEGREHVFLDCRIDMDDNVEKRFICLAKFDRKLERLLVSGGGRHDGSRPLSKTSIFETPTKLRDERVWKKIKCAPPSERASRHCNKTSSALLMAVEDKFSSIDVPETSGVRGMAMDVLMTRLGNAIWVDASATTLEFLADVVDAQITSGSVHRTRPRPAAKNGLVGVSMSALSGHVRARKRGPDGKTLNKHMKLDKYGVQQAIASAELFIATPSDANAAEPTLDDALADGDQEPVGLGDAEGYVDEATSSTGAPSTP